MCQQITFLSLAEYKCYIFGSESENAIGIIGSSNFTRKGLSGNLELNALEDDGRIVNYQRLNEKQHPSHRSWFENVWNKSDDWNKKFNTEIIGLSKFGNLSYSPYEIYIRILYEIYGDDIEIEEKLKSEEVFERKNTLTVFQQESVRKALNRLNDKKIGMCLIGDSVGLGKSYIARDIIERIGYYERKNVVIVCPASLRSDWQKHIDELNVNAMIYSITEFANDSSFEQIKNDLSLRKNNSKEGNAIHLLMIDESHNLKTQGSKSFQNLLQVITEKTYCSDLPKVLMLSATPVNNGVKDLANQILLAKGGNDKFFTHFGIENITTLFGRTQREFKNQDNEEVFGELYPILNKIMVKRTKHQVKKDFPDATLNGKKIIFPDEQLMNELYELDNKAIRKSISEILSQLEKENELLYDAFTVDLTENEEEREEVQGVLDFFSSFTPEKKKRINQREFESVFHFMDRAIKNLKLSPYSYLSEKTDRTDFEEVQANARKNLTGVMKVTLFKSFDSSIFTFRKRIEKYEIFLSNFETLFFTHKKVVRTEVIQKAIADANKIKGFFDYRSLLETHLKYDDNVDIFTILIENILPHAQNRFTGNEIGRDWSNIKRESLLRKGIWRVQWLRVNTKNFTDGFKYLIQEIEKDANKFINFFDNSISIKIDFDECYYEETDKIIYGNEAILNITFSGKPIPKHQSFLNEARLSALAISLYLASIKANPLSGALKILVLDDLLIGLDMSNRLPLLDYKGVQQRTGRYKPVIGHPAKGH